MKGVEILQIETDNPLYQQERELRNRILLRPIGIPDFGWEHHDDRSWHFVATWKNRVIGCVVLVRLDEDGTTTQLIQMAVETEFQGQGIGKALVKELISFARGNGVEEIQIHAREEVTEFYARLRFAIVGEPFEEAGIRHRHMVRHLR
jgi:predicted GNAT family N-acyltransferase